MGTGQWDIQVYLDVYHPGMTEASLLDEGDPDSSPFEDGSETCLALSQSLFRLRLL